MSTDFITHNRIRLALHTLRGGEGHALLLLHGLGEQSPTTAPAFTADWAGPVMALDFTGHGASTVPMGGGYSAETMLADADIALAHLGGTPAIRPQSQASSDRTSGFRVSAGGLACADEIEMMLRFDDGSVHKVAVDGCKLLN